MNARSILFGAASVAALLWSGQSLAQTTGETPPPSSRQSLPPQDDETVDVDEVVVTGTPASGRSRLETTSPVDVISDEALQRQGSTELAQGLSALAPSISFARPSITDGTDTVRPATLRGLGPDQTLVLLNSTRRHTSALVNVNGSVGRGSAAVDLNAIPSAAIERVSQAHGGGKKAKIIHVIPTVGGCGSTTVACNVAASLAKHGKTALVDLDLIRGGVAGYFDARPRYTIADVMDSAEKVDKILIDNALTIHPNSGVAVLARPDLPEDTLRVSAPGVARLLGLLGRHFDYVVIDSLMSIDPIYSATIASADVNLMVMQLNVPSAKNAERFIGALRRMGIDANKIKLVVNRYVKKGSDIEPDEVERALGLKIGWLVPNDFKNAIAAINFGEPVVLRAPKSEISTSLLGLAASLNGRN